MGIVLYLVSYYAMALPLQTIYAGMSLGEKMAAALIPNMALNYAILVMTGLDGKGKHLYRLCAFWLGIHSQLRQFNLFRNWGTLVEFKPDRECGRHTLCLPRLHNVRS